MDPTSTRIRATDKSRGEWVRAVLDQGGPNVDRIPAELKTTDGLFHFDLLPSDRDVRLARVDLGTGVFTDPVRQAGEQTEAAVALAGFHCRRRQMAPAAWAYRCCRRLRSEYRHLQPRSTWSLVLKRLQRIRNALAHGGPIEDSTVMTVDRFAMVLASWSQSAALEGLLDGTGVAPAHQAHMEDANLWEAALASAPTAVEALVGPL